MQINLNLQVWAQCFKTPISANLQLQTIIRFTFCDIEKNQGQGKRYQPKPKAEADNAHREITLTETLIILDIAKTESNNCFIIH